MTAGSGGIAIEEVREDADAFTAAVDAILDEAAQARGHPFVGDRVHLRASAADGAFLGGLVGVRMQGWFYVKFLAVSGTARGAGVGARLLSRAEEIARAEGLAGVYLDTFDFQAPAFYLRAGYMEIGRLPAVGGAPQRIWFAKTLETAGRKR